MFCLVNSDSGNDRILGWWEGPSCFGLGRGDHSSLVEHILCQRYGVQSHISSYKGSLVAGDENNFSLSASAGQRRWYLLKWGLMVWLEYTAALLIHICIWLHVCVWWVARKSCVWRLLYMKNSLQMRNPHSIRQRAELDPFSRVANIIWRGIFV